MLTHSFSLCIDHCRASTQTASRESMTWLCVDIVCSAQAVLLTPLNVGSIGESVSHTRAAANYAFISRTLRRARTTSSSTSAADALRTCLLLALVAY